MINAVRAFDSARKALRIAWMRRESSSRNYQLDAPLIGATSYQGFLHTAHDGFGAAA
jgi:hypothetical protein